MDTYVLNGITVTPFLDNRRKNKTGDYPVKIRVTYKRDRIYYSTGKSLPTSDWEKLNKTRNAELLSTKKDIQISFEKVKDLVQSLENEGRFSFEMLNARLGKCMSNTINIAFREKIAGLTEAGAIGNSITYSCALKHLEKYAGEKVAFETITVDWLKKYEKAMLAEGKSYTTIGIYFRNIRVLINEAKAAEIIKEFQYPFGKGKYEIPVGKGRKLALTLQQIKQIVTYADGAEATECYRDLWFFSYLCNGININDMLKLKYSNINGEEIHFYRSKTINKTKEKKGIYALITPEMKKIINRWGNPEKSPSNYIFSFLDGYDTPIEQKREYKI